MEMSLKIGQRVRGRLAALSVLSIAIAPILFLSCNWTTWTGEGEQQKTDDAYVRADVTPLSTKAAGLVASVEVSDYQAVRAGDLLVRLRDEDFRAQVDQAEAAVELSPVEPAILNNVPREETMRRALAENPQIAAAMEAVQQAKGALIAAKSAFIPDVSPFARHNYQNGVPFLVHNFGTFGLALNYDVFDFGKRRAVVREREAQLAKPSRMWSV
jgi:multidrug resistance efflux pump